MNVKQITPLAPTERAALEAAKASMQTDNLSSLDLFDYRISKHEKRIVTPGDWHEERAQAYRFSAVALAAQIVNHLDTVPA